MYFQSCGTVRCSQPTGLFPRSGQITFHSVFFIAIIVEVNVSMTVFAFNPQTTGEISWASN